MRSAIQHLFPLFLVSSCYNLIDLVPKVEPAGGTVTVATASLSYATTALGDGRTDPLKIEGASPQVTFSLTAVDADASDKGRATLSQQNGGAVTITLSARSRLEIHENQTGCVAMSGTAHLTTDSSYHLSGDFSAQGKSATSDAACEFSGTLTGIPYQH